MNAIAPVCPVSRSQPTQRTQPPGIDINRIPRAHDLITVINAINQLNNVITQITRGQPQVNNVHPPQEFGFPTLKPPPPPQYAQMRWVEVYRDYVQQEVVDADDPTLRVPIKTLSLVIFRDVVTGSLLIYTP